MKNELLMSTITAVIVKRENLRSRESLFARDDRSGESDQLSHDG